MCDHRKTEFRGQQRTEMNQGPPETYIESPFAKAIQSLAAINTKWRVDVGIPESAPEWIRGIDFLDAYQGPFRALLDRIGERFKTEDRKTIAASFALRFGWTASSAIGPYITFRCVPDISLANVSFRFRENTLFDRSAIYSLHGSVLETDPNREHPSVRSAEDHCRLLETFRSELVAQASPVVDALFEWSKFSKSAIWGMITSSWAALFLHVYERIGTQTDALPLLETFFAGNDEVARMQPRFHPVTLGGVTHLYQRRASCCRYYLLPQGSLCASCPLVSQEKRIQMNLEWMKKQLES
jgi:hypothetical protein